MPFVCARHRVRDYTEWKAVFDSFRDARRAGGEVGYHLFHTDGDPNDIHMIFEFASFEGARAFLESPELAEAMEKAGVLEEPAVAFVEKYESGTP